MAIAMALEYAMHKREMPGMLRKELQALHGGRMSMNLSRIADKCRAADRLIARIDERERNSHKFGVSGPGQGRESIQASANLLGDSTGSHGAKILPTDSNNLAPTEAERAVDKYWGKYLPEIAKLERAVDGIAVKPPHDCFENFSTQLVCGICGARYRTTAERIGG